MHPTPTRPEGILLLACFAMLLAAVFAPPLAQPAHLHDFADQRVLWGVPFALDVLSNLPFAFAGVVGLRALQGLPARAVDATERACARLFFIGLLVTTAASAWYHLQPSDVGLAIDRGGMAIAFAGLLALLAATRVSARAGIALGAAVLLLAPASVATWYQTGNVLPWAIVQFGGIAVIVLVLATTRVRPGALDVRWSLVLLAYAVAKWLEVNDHAIFEASGELLSGHTLKHVLAAAAAWPVIAAVNGPVRRQNGPRAPAHAA